MALPSLSLSFPSRPWLTRKSRIERAWSFRHALEGMLIALLVGLAVLAAIWLTAPQLPPWVLPALGAVAALFLVAAGLWLALPAWFHPGFRWLAWRASLVAWRLRSFRPVLPAAGAVLIALTVLAGWWLYSVAGSDGAKEVTIVLTSILLLWSILFLRVKARKRLFVADFLNYTQIGDKDSGKAIAARLRNELSSIAALYRDIDEALPLQGSKTPGLCVSVQDTGADFKEVLGAGFTLSAFGLQLPVGALVSLLGGRSWGPRLTGSLHQEEDRLALVAEIGGGKREGSWRVSTDDLTEEDRQRTGMPAVYKLVEQMAYRVLTSQLDVGSPRWEAVRSFTEGLRAYRRVQRTEKDRTIYLRKAERELIRARNEDNRFVQCHYDLGVVYQQLGQYASAEAAFRQTVEEDPEQFDSYYGLATLYLDRGDCRNARIQADKGLRIRPWDAAAWNVRGLAQVGEKGDPERAAWPGILQSFEIATGLGWRSLCREILRGGPGSPEARAQTILAQICTGNLAEAVTHCADCLEPEDGEPREPELDAERRKSAGLFRHALCLQPGNPDLHFGLGHVLFQLEDWAGARDAFYEAYGDALDPGKRAVRWAYLAAAHAQVGNPDGVEAACRNFLDFAVPPEERVLTAESLRYLLQDDSYLKTLDLLSRELGYIASVARAEGGKHAFESMQRAVAFLQRLETEEPDERRCRKMPRLLDRADRQWARAQIALRLARWHLEGAPAHAYDLIHQAIEILKEGHWRQVEKQGLHTLMARALLLEARRSGDRGPLIPALDAAEKSAQQEPASAVRRWVLSEVYSALKDFEQVSQESDTSLALGSAAHLLTDPEALTYVAENWLQQISDVHTPGSWKRGLKQGCAFLDHIREIIESQPIDPKQMVVHALLHHWLGRFHCELQECDAGIAQMEIAIQMGARPVESRLILGRAYAEAGAFSKAEQAYLSALRRPAMLYGEMEPDLTRALKDVRPLDELQIEILLRLALLYASTGSNLRRAALLADLARWLMRYVMLPGARRREHRALHHEVLGRLFLHRGQPDASIAELERSRELCSSASNCYHLARAYELKARLGRDKQGARAKACAVCDQADRLDMPQRYHQRLDELRDRLNGPRKPRGERVLVPFPSAGLKEIGKGAEAN